MHHNTGEGRRADPRRGQLGMERKERQQFSFAAVFLLTLSAAIPQGSGIEKEGLESNFGTGWSGPRRPSFVGLTQRRCRPHSGAVGSCRLSSRLLEAVDLIDVTRPVIVDDNMRASSLAGRRPSSTGEVSTAPGTNVC